MAAHGESELIDNFIMELQPYLVLIDQGIAELAQQAPDTRVVGQAIESLAIIRDASGVLAFDGLVELTSALDAAMVGLRDSVPPDSGQLLARARALASGMHHYMDALADGHDTDELVSRVLTFFEDEQLADIVVAEAPAERQPAGMASGVGMLDPGNFVVTEVDPELREIFEEEAIALVASFTRGALRLVSAPDRPATLSSLRRDAHTLKGAANMTGFPLIGSLGGSVETLLDAHIDCAVPVERETIAIVLSARKLLAGMLASLDDLSELAEPARALNQRAAIIRARFTPLMEDSAEPSDDAGVEGLGTESLAATAVTELLETDEVIESISVQQRGADVFVAPEPDLTDQPLPAMAEPDAEQPATAELTAEWLTDTDLAGADIAADLLPFSLDLDEPAASPPAADSTDELASSWAWLAEPVPFAEAEPFVEDIVVENDELAPEATAPEATAPEATAPEEADYEVASVADLELPSIAPEAIAPEAISPDTDAPELDVYEMAAEIAMLARLRTSLQPQNATFFPTDASGLTDDIDALTAKFIGDVAGDPATLHVAAAEDDPAQPFDSAGPAAGDAQADFLPGSADLDEPRRVSPLTALAGMAQEKELLGHALLDLAFDTNETPEIVWPASADHLISDERMRQELSETFAIEAAEYADSLTLAAMALERDPESDDALRELTRVLHTLKGAAAAAGFDAIGERCHAIEDELADGADINRAFTDQILELASQIEQSTTGGTLPLDAPADDSETPQPAQPATRTAGDLRVEMRRLDGLLNLVGELVINRSTLDQRLQRLSGSLDELSHMTERLRRSGQTLERVAGEASLFGPLPAAPGDDRIVPFNDVVAHGHEFDTLEMDRYTDLDVLARELGEVAADIGAVAGEVRNLRGDFETVSSHQRRLTNDIQDELMGIRMVPLATLSPLLHRVVRRVSHECDKDVDLLIEGSEIAFDKSLVDALGDALLHLLRNAVDHGIESPAVRWTTGKPERGRIIVRAWQDRGNAVVEVIDDGRGIDTARLVERARTYGFVTAEHVSEAEALQLMFLPGFTTRDSASSVSGRGVGLDAVREAVERVKGRVTVDTKPGAGTIFQLRLPVMLAVAQAFLVEAGGRRYAVPLADVDFVADRRQATLSRVGKAALVEVNDTIMPAIDLATRLAGDRDRLDEETGWLLVTRTGGEPRAMRVDALEGQQEIVVKPLGRYLSAAPGVTGATILGDGQLALIIDVAEVTGKHALAEPIQAAQPTEPTPLDSARASAGVALVVDDSLSVRRVLARTLERHGWTALQAHDGVEALEKVQAGGIDIVVTDIEMPRMDGFELISSLRRGGWLSLPIVVLTSRSSSKHRDKAIELGANAYIVKPFQEQELLETLDRETVAIRAAG